MMKIINRILLLFMLLAVFIMTNAVRLNAGTIVKESDKLAKVSQPLVVETKKTAPVKKITKPFPQKKKLRHTLQRNNVTIVKQGNRVILKFSSKVVKLTLFDHNSKKIGSFPGGVVFDITKIIKKVKGEKLKIQYHISNPTVIGSKGNSKLARPDPMSKIIKYAKIPRGLYERPRFKKIRLGDDNEPANRDISGAVPVPAGNVLGSVGGDDEFDYLSYTAPGEGYGYYVEISRLSGNVRLYSYDVNPTHLTSDRNKLWVSLAPGTIFYIGVEPNSSYDATEYKINIVVRPIPDALEPDDDWPQASAYDDDRTRFLCTVMTSEGAYRGANPWRQGGLWDTYKIDGHGGQTMHVSLTNAGLPSNTRVYAAILGLTGISPRGFEAGSSSNGIDFRYGPLPDSVLYIRFRNYSSTSDHDNLDPYGTGTGPACFTGSGYTLNVTFE
jgi:hypothetical protein